ncbi:MAG: hypothetical protein ACTSRY_08340 [Alphaproteobacteria bacterium]
MTRKWIATVAKLAISVGLIAVLAANIDLERAAARVGQLDWWAIPAGLALLLVQVVILGLRWRLVSTIANAPMGASRAVILMLVGQLARRCPRRWAGTRCGSSCCAARGLP